MKKLFLLTALLSACVLFLQAQTAEDALRYSNLTYGGTARSVSMGGAFGALGADFSTLSTNPAGIGVYKKSIVSFTPSVYTGETTSDYMGSESYDNKYNFNFGNAGFVLVSDTKENSVFKNFQFGFGVNRTNNFHNRSLTEGFNTENSIRNMWADYANMEGSLNPFDTELAVNTGLIFYDSVGVPPNVPPGYINDRTREGYQEGYVMQRQYVVTEGSMNEVVFSAGTNISDVLYLGATIGLPYLNYSRTSTFVESDNLDSIPYFNSLEYTERLTTSGSGFNFKLGFILKPVYWLRVGGAFHTPTFFNDMYDEWSSDLEAHYDNNQNEVQDATAYSPDGYYDYSLETPMKLMGSVAVVVGKVGLISAEYEYSDYTKAKFRSDMDDFYNVNNTISNSYTEAHNLKFGTEWMVAPMVKIRGGYAIYSSPYAESVNDGGVKQVVSFGAGIRDRNFFADLAFAHSFAEQDYYMYSSEYITPAQNTYISNQVLMTLGFRF